MNPIFIVKQGYIQAKNLTHIDLTTQPEALVLTANNNPQFLKDTKLWELIETLDNIAITLPEYIEHQIGAVRVETTPPQTNLYGINAEMVTGWIDAVARIQPSVDPESLDTVAELLEMLRSLRLATRQKPEQSYIDEVLKHLPIAMKHLRLAEAMLILENDRKKKRGGNHVHGV
jgi:hypothetical protein